MLTYTFAKGQRREPVYEQLYDRINADILVRTARRGGEAARPSGRLAEHLELSASSR